MAPRKVPANDWAQRRRRRNTWCRGISFIGNEVRPALAILHLATFSHVSRLSFLSFTCSTGSLWHAGENCARGRDHTIYATAPGYVRYYKDPARNPKKKYIGVALKKEGRGSVLPTPQNAATRRRLGMYLTPMAVKGDRAFLEMHLSASSPGRREDENVQRGEAREGEGEAQRDEEVQEKQVKKVHPRPNFNYDSREGNWSIGRTAEKKGIKVREYDHGDRWLAWRKRAKRQKRGMLMRVTKAAQKGKGKKKVMKRVVEE